MLLLISAANAQHGVRFMTGSLDGVRAVAKEQNKNLLIDTYASWCIPCKRMDKIFDQKKVGDFFNENYLTYRVNVEGPYGDAVKAQYQVVFLPTIIIIGPDGEVKYKVDREMSAEELLTIGELALQPGIKIASDATGFRRNGETSPESQVYTEAGSPDAKARLQEQKEPKVKKKQKKKAVVAAPPPPPTDNSKIVHVLAKGEVPPPVLKQEAYHSLELMDGSHKVLAQKYLATQNDWNTKENMRFILDFVNTTDSKEYKHIIKHKAQYEAAFGTKSVDNTLQVVVYRKLYKGIPRPSKQEVQELYEELGYENPRTLTYTYFINRHRTDEDHQQVYDTYMYYHEKVVVLDIAGLEAFANYLAEYQSAYTDTQLQAAASLLDNKGKMHSEELSLQALHARVLVLAGKCKRAKKVLKKATNAARKQKRDTLILDEVVIAC